MNKQLKTYLKVRGEDLLTDALFITLDDTPLTTRQIQERIKYYGDKAGIKNVRCSPHTFRHTFAKLAIKNGADIFTLQEILGHESVQMVKKYVTMFSKDVKEGHRN